MQTIGGGVVRFVDLAWIECPENPGVAECTRGGAIEILWNGRVMETFDVHVGDELRVDDGSTVSAGTWLYARTWVKNVRADIPSGHRAIVRWNDAPYVRTADPVTGLERMAFSPNVADETVRLDLVDERDAARSWSFVVPREAQPIVVDVEKKRK